MNNSYFEGGGGEIIRHISLNLSQAQPSPPKQCDEQMDTGVQGAP